MKKTNLFLCLRVIGIVLLALLVTWRAADAFTLPPRTTVPSVVGLSQASAEATIISSNLRVGNITTASSQTVPAGFVISQNPSVGLEVVIDTFVHLVVSTGNNAPTGVADVYTFMGPRRHTVDADHGVLANDTDPEGDTLTAILDTAPAQGELTLRADGSFDYKPTRGFTGTDVFNYLANDGFLESAPVTVTITVGPLAMPWLPLLLDD